MTTPFQPTSYNPMPGGQGDMPASPEPQSLQVKAGKAKAWLNDTETKALAKNATAEPPVRVMIIDGVPTVVPRVTAPGAAGTGQQVSDEDLDMIGADRITHPECEVPGCTNEGSNQIFSSAGKPLSINRQGQLVFGNAPAMPHAGMTAADRARAEAGIAGVVGPSGVMAVQMPKCSVNVCWQHQTLPHAPKTAPKRFRSGPYGSYFAASRRAQEVGMRTRREPHVYPTKTAELTDEWWVEGDDGAAGYKGELEEL